MSQSNRQRSGMSSTHNVLNEADHATALLIIELQQEDVADNARKRILADEEPSPDAEAAIRLYESELRASKRIRLDGNVARELERQDMPPNEALLTSMLAEDTAEAAPENDIVHFTTDAAATAADEHGDVEAKIEGPTVPDAGQEHHHETYECAACADEKQDVDVFHATCGHHYCRDCLEYLFQTAMTDETLYPPSCCQQSLVLGDVKPYLTQELQVSFTAKEEELGTHERTYCYVPTCSTSIGRASIAGETATCPACNAATCVLCKSEAHDGDCPKDEALKSLLATAEAEGWKRYDKCRTMIEITFGCNHMTCVCKSEFCYVCREIWKTCPCPRWEEERLLDRALVVADRERRDEEGIVLRDADVEQATQTLRDNPLCAHPNWRYIAGAQICEQCRHALPVYLNECGQCRVRVCDWCTINLVAIPNRINRRHRAVILRRHRQLSLLI